jgi:hypothetical protein
MGIMRYAVLLVIALAVVVPAVFFMIYFEPAERPFGFDEGNALARHAWSGLFLILGILASALNKNLETSRSLANGFFSRQTIKSLLSAPIVFLANYLVTRDLTDPITAYLLAFETGFCCDAILAKRQGERIK